MCGCQRLMALLSSDGLGLWASWKVRVIAFSEVFRKKYGSGLFRGKVLVITLLCKDLCKIVFGKWRQEVQFKASLDYMRPCYSN